jgi:ABC-type hemin transport system substrate-binding protein
MKFHRELFVSIFFVVAAATSSQVVCGSVAGTAKIIVYAGTPNMATTIADVIGGGVTGC